MTSVDAVFRDRYGLHPRAAMQIQKMANGFRSKITIAGIAQGGSPVDARSLISLVSAGIRAGEKIRITAEGDDEAAAAEAIRALVEKGVCHP